MEPQNIKIKMEEFKNNPCLKDTVISTNDTYISCKVSKSTLEFYKLFYGDLIKTEPNTTQKNKKTKLKRLRKKKKHKKRLY